jgi:hypothetical protein
MSARSSPSGCQLAEVPSAGSASLASAGAAPLARAVCRRDLSGLSVGSTGCCAALPAALITTAAPTTRLTSNPCQTHSLPPTSGNTTNSPASSPHDPRRSQALITPHPSVPAAETRYCGETRLTATVTPPAARPLQSPASGKRHCAQSVLHRVFASPDGSVLSWPQ